jgi:osmotically-inducible protein OsmY
MSRAGGVIDMNPSQRLDIANDPHRRGRGPQAYTRSDARILEDVSEELTEHEHIDEREITIAVVDGEVTLSGSVPDEAMKHLAQVAARQLRGVRVVHNRLSVRPLAE